MPHFVPVYDPERPLCEQKGDDPGLMKHRKWDTPHAIRTAPRSATDSQGPDPCNPRLFQRRGNMVRNEKGLWVPAARTAAARRQNEQEVDAAARTFRAEPTDSVKAPDAKRRECLMNSQLVSRYRGGTERAKCSDKGYGSTVDGEVSDRVIYTGDYCNRKFHTCGGGKSRDILHRRSRSRSSDRLGSSNREPSAVSKLSARRRDDKYTAERGAVRDEFDYVSPKKKRPISGPSRTFPPNDSMHASRS